MTEDDQSQVEAIRARVDAWDYSLHWRSAEGDEMAAKQLDATRTRPDMTDFEMANWVFLCDRNSLELIAAQTMAKERIRWLSAQLAKSNVDLVAVLSLLDAARAELAEVREAGERLNNQVVIYQTCADECINSGAFASRDSVVWHIRRARAAAAALNKD
jgi:hypothetical protein